MKQPGRLVVWPSDIDSTKSRKQGRKLSKGSAVQVPRLEEIREAADKLTLEVELFPGKARPSSWWERGGYIVAQRDGARTTLLRSLAGEIKKARASRVSQDKPKK